MLDKPFVACIPITWYRVNEQIAARPPGWGVHKESMRSPWGVHEPMRSAGVHGVQHSGSSSQHTNVLEHRSPGVQEATTWRIASPAQHVKCQHGNMPTCQWLTTSKPVTPYTHSGLKTIPSYHNYICTRM